MPIPDAPLPTMTNARLLSEAVFEHIGAAIVDGTLAEGEVLRDADLQRWLGVSRTPIREALSRLALLGLVETAPSRFTRVTFVDEDLVRDTLVYAGFMAGLSVRIAVPRLSDDDVTAAVAMLNDVIDANESDDHERLFDTARVLVRFMADRAGNQVFSAVLRETGLVAMRNLRSYRPVIGSRAERTEWYRALRAAMVEHDGDAAESAVRGLHHLVETAGSTPEAAARHARVG